MTKSCVLWCATALIAGTVAFAQNPPAQQGQQQQGLQQTQPGQPGQRGGGGGGQRGGGRGRAQIMTLATTAWTDGGMIPVKFTQAGAEVSPALTWSNAPADVVSFVLIAHDLDAAGSNGFDTALHWLVWNIPGSATSLPEAVPQGPELADGTRQISLSGPYYRGPGAPANGPAHHYVFELFALATKIDVAPAAASPAETRAAVVAAMAGHVRGKGVLTGLVKRSGAGH
jgi:Raf kinase inhibitor-like YbhB/YbcL family protein